MRPEAAKAVVRALHAALDAAPPEGVAEAMAPFVAPDWRWRASHPFGPRVGPEAVAAAFWAPLRAAFAAPRRRPDVLMAGTNAVEGGAGTWVASMGHLMGLFDRPWLGIRPTRRLALLRYAEWSRVEEGRVVETALFLDVPHLMAQVNRHPFPPQTGAQLVQPGPATHDGVMRGAADPGETAATHRVLARMMDDMEGRAPDIPPDYRAQLRRSWAEDMCWWGPTGIGASWTIEGYVQGHAGPFDAAFRGATAYHRDRALIAEGRFAGFFGWGNMTVRNAGGFMGLTGHARAVPLDVVDIYRREGDRLAENWVFIDLLGWLHAQGLDVLGRMEGLAP